MKIALIQQSASSDKQQNLNRGLESTRAAARDGANVVCFAELAFEPFYPQVPASSDFADLAEPIPGPITEQFCELAAELGIVVF